MVHWTPTSIAALSWVVKSIEVGEMGGEVLTRKTDSFGQKRIRQLSTHSSPHSSVISDRVSHFNKLTESFLNQFPKSDELFLNCQHIVYA